MMIVYIGLVSRSKVDDFNLRFGGFTDGAIEEFCRLEPPGNQDIVKRLPKAPPDIDCDSRFNVRTRRLLELAVGLAARTTSSQLEDAFLRALGFYWPLVPQPFAYDDSKGRERAKTTVLGPQRCASLLELWDSTDWILVRREIDKWPIAFKDAGPGYVCQNGEQLVNYLSFYQAQLAQAVAENRFYMTFYQ